MMLSYLWRLTHLLLRKTFFDHFCAGETSQEIVPRMHELRRYNVGGILDYAAEAKDGELPEIVKPTEEVSEEEIVGAPMSSRSYDYKNEAICDANAKIFRTAVRAVKDATPDGFAAIKLSGLGNPHLLERMSSCLGEICRLYKRLSNDEVSTEPFYAIDRSFKIDFETFKTGWLKMFEGKSEAELKSMFQAMDTDEDGLITYLEWSSSVKLSEINELVRGCKHRGRMYHAALNAEELQLYRNMLQRVQGILDLAQELGVRVMIDAEWTDIQPAIDHITIFMQRIYNTGDLPIVFNTYQTYLKGMPTRVQRDLQRSRREGWRFGAKLVRGAYMVSEREKALKRELESPVCETYEETEDNFHRAIDLILDHKEEVGKGAGGAAAEVLVASHNRGSIERTIRKMAELGVSQDSTGASAVSKIMVIRMASFGSESRYVVQSTPAWNYLKPHRPAMPSHRLKMRLCTALCSDALSWRDLFKHDQIKLFGVSAANGRWKDSEHHGCFLTGRFSLFVLAHLGWRFLIYLTRWSFLLETIYILLAVYVTVQARTASKRQSTGDDGSSLHELYRLPRSVQAMALLWNLTFPVSILVCLAFWTLINPVWDMKIHPGYVVVFEHFLNMLLFMVEFLLNKNVFVLKHGVVLFAYALLYTTWTLIHYAAKIGVAPSMACHDYPLDECPIYAVLDWHHPWRTVIVIAFVIFASFLIQLAVWKCTRLRDRRFAHDPARTVVGPVNVI
ncbi:PRODH [Symbiodinium pilosum]|uniref:Proline dehydrogenase n=1 Tax=Symbiodinium pilosum TaxID=2952 RepID=A0A812T5D5_SYMPI|nr:PRODH [Symbiodinium pilosum]